MEKEKIIRIVTGHFNISYEKMLKNSNSRKPEHLFKRYILTYFLNKELNRNYTTLQSMGYTINKSHSNVIHILKEMENLLSYDKNIISEVNDISHKIQMAKVGLNYIKVGKLALIYENCIQL